MTTRTPDVFGCQRCWPASADAAWEATWMLHTVAELIDEGHFRVAIRVCRSCTQGFAHVFTESIDWADADDPQRWTLLPVTGEELSALTQRAGPLTEAALNALGGDRRSLVRDYPKGTTPVCSWSKGLSVGPHD